MRLPSDPLPDYDEIACCMNCGRAFCLNDLQDGLCLECLDADEVI